MKVPHALAEIVSEFSGLNHTPDFKAVRSMPNCSRQGSRDCSRAGSRACSRAPSGTSTPVRKHSGERRHSTIITVGADELPTVTITNSDDASTSDHNKFGKCHSAQNFPHFVCSSSLREKLNNIKRSKSSQSFHGLKEEREKEKEEEEEEQEEEDFKCPMRKSSSVSSYRII